MAEKREAEGRTSDGRSGIALKLLTFAPLKLKY